MKYHVLVFALALLVPAGALHAATSDDQRTYYREGGMDNAKATSITGVQQHSIFLEIIVEEEKEEEDIKPFAAIVGLIKKCDREKDRSDFDNAVLWFNDQFLFGDKQAFSETNETPEDALGENPPDSEIWPNCWIPNGFAHAVGDANDIDTFKHAMENEGEQLHGGPDFSYVKSFYISDPNGANWIVDKFELTYPRHCHVTSNGSEEETAGRCTTEQMIEEPMYTVHLQVDKTTGQGFRDTATWAYEDGELRPGMPHNESVQDDPDTAENERQTEPSIEYDFLLAVDMGGGDEMTHNDTSGGEAWQGNSHPHRGEDNQTKAAGGECTEGSDGVGDEQQGCASRSPPHTHDTEDFSIFFNETAPNFVEENRYWDEHGAPPPVTEGCESGDSGDPERDRAVEDRSFQVCDRQHVTPYHKHDGTETVDP